MGINLESVALLKELHLKNLLPSGKVLDFGRQDMFIPSSKISRLLSIDLAISNPEQLYKFFGFDSHQSIDGVKAENCFQIDLNTVIDPLMNKELISEMVTNFGTSEHIFNQYSVFKNMHNLCSTGGIMLHAIPIMGNAQHGYFNYQPRLFYELALINKYEVLAMYIAPDYWPILIPYSKDNLFKNRFKDLMLLVAFQKKEDKSFELPFDGFFKNEAEVYGYATPASGDQRWADEFESFLTSGEWVNLNRSNTEVLKIKFQSLIGILGIRSRLKSIFKNINQ